MYVSVLFNSYIQCAYHCITHTKSQKSCISQKNRNLREYDLRVINSWENLPFLSYWISVIVTVLLLTATFRFAHKINFTNSKTLVDRSVSTDRNARYLWLVRIKRTSKKQKIKRETQAKTKRKRKGTQVNKKRGKLKKKIRKNEQFHF